MFYMNTQSPSLLYWFQWVFVPRHIVFNIFFQQYQVWEFFFCSRKPIKVAAGTWCGDSIFCFPKIVCKTSFSRYQSVVFLNRFVIWVLWTIPPLESHLGSYQRKGIHMAGLLILHFPTLLPASLRLSFLWQHTADEPRPCHSRRSILCVHLQPC